MKIEIDTDDKFMLLIGGIVFCVFLLLTQGISCSREQERDSKAYSLQCLRMGGRLDTEVPNPRCHLTTRP